MGNKRCWAATPLTASILPQNIPIFIRDSHRCVYAWDYAKRCKDGHVHQSGREAEKYGCSWDDWDQGDTCIILYEGVIVKD